MTVRVVLAFAVGVVVGAWLGIRLLLMTAGQGIPEDSR